MQLHLTVLSLFALAGGALGQGAADTFDFDIVPSFRGAAHAEFAGWDLFTSAYGGANLPDDPASTALVTLTQTTSGAILTSTLNIYQPVATPIFELDATVPMDAQEVVLQLRSVGTALAAASVVLEYTDGAGAHALPPTDSLILSAGALSELYFEWELASVPAEITTFTLRFAGAGAHMSLDAILFDVLVDGSIGTPYCSANANSTGAPGVIEARGSAVVSSNDVTLTASSLPLNAAGFFLVSAAQGFVAGPGGSQGNLCLAGSIGRFSGQVFHTGTSGTGTLVLDLAQMPQPMGSVATGVGDTWNFQCWHRDANPQVVSNFTNAVSVTFR